MSLKQLEIEDLSIGDLLTLDGNDVHRLLTICKEPTIGMRNLDNGSVIYGPLSDRKLYGLQKLEPKEEGDGMNVIKGFTVEGEEDADTASGD